MTFPQARLHRLRASAPLRALLQEVRLDSLSFIAPIFIKEGIDQPIAVPSMPGVFQQSLASLQAEVATVVAAGISTVLLFGIPRHKDPQGSSSYDPEGIIQKAIRLIKQHFPDIIVIADCCLCEYTSHGHCGLMHNHKLHNDATLEILQKVALSYAACGADIIAPSGSMDGMVGAIRQALEQNNFPQVSIMSYAVKYASSFYGPFRQAGGCADVFKGDRKHYQMPPSQRREALREIQQDIQEGADMLIVKPGTPYLDIICAVKEESLLPVVAYQVSGEYAMLKIAGQHGILDEKAAFEECFLGYKRAGTDLIISYYAKEMAALIKAKR